MYSHTSTALVLAGFQDLMDPTVQLEEIGWDVWGVLGMSFIIDGSVLYKSIQVSKAPDVYSKHAAALTRVQHSLLPQNLMENKPADLTLWQYIKRVRDPTTLAVLLEDGGACIGILMAIVGIGLSQATGNPMFDRYALSLGMHQVHSVH